MSTLKRSILTVGRFFLFMRLRDSFFLWSDSALGQESPAAKVNYGLNHQKSIIYKYKYIAK